MPLEDPKYDVAISFLATDEAIAAALTDQLSESLNVFFFPKKQEDLAGTDGMETMRTPFTEDSRVMVVLYRERWGKTRWTAIEETAVKDACFNGGWERLFFITLDRTSVLPKWLPETYVRYNWEDFGADQVVGIVKSRALKNGGQLTPPSALKKAELFRKDEEYRHARASIAYTPGLSAIQEQVEELYALVKARADEITGQGHMNIMCEYVLQARAVEQLCTLTNDRVGVIVSWYTPDAGTLEKSALTVREFGSGLILPSEVGRKMYWEQPKTLRDTKYHPDLSRTRELGWSAERSNDFLQNAKLAEEVLIRFIELAGKQASKTR